MVVVLVELPFPFPLTDVVDGGGAVVGRGGCRWQSWGCYRRVVGHGGRRRQVVVECQAPAAMVVVSRWSCPSRSPPTWVVVAGGVHQLRVWIVVPLLGRVL
jgi:hypothetical protein